MRREDIRDEYFEWLCSIVHIEINARDISWRLLMERLHEVEFEYSIDRDKNRYNDGIDLRYRFACFNGYEDCSDSVKEDLAGPCSILEMMVALALRCEETIMYDPAYGDRTAQWFNEMLINLGLNTQNDNYYDRLYVNEVLTRFLHREYEPNGKGGLFTIKHCKADLREVEIWLQLNWYINGLI